MIIQTGMRTDIPAFYADWFANRLKAGFVCVRNPYNRSSVTRYKLDPKVVDVIGFCTKNPRPMMKYLDLLKPYGQYWFVTITPYGPEIEPNVPPVDLVAEDFVRLSKSSGAGSLAWRYDPIFVSDEYPVERHIEEFERIARKLSGYTHSCVISFIDLYEKTKQNFPEARMVKKEERLVLGEALTDIAKKYDMVVRPCGEGDELSQFGADCRGCMTKEIYETAIHSRLSFPRSAAKSQRAECACTFGRDIGEYNSCGHFCKYCYANIDKDKVIANMKRHNPDSPFLIGNFEAGDIIHEANQKSWIDGQMSIFNLGI